MKRGVTRRRWGLSTVHPLASYLALSAVFSIALPRAHAMDISSHYSPWNRSRPARPATRFIILHTTEGSTKGSLKDVTEHGEAHYLVDPGGHVYRIIHRNKIATHAGRSMWKGIRNLDSCSVSIEVVGYHDRPITKAQYGAIRELVGALQKAYNVPDTDVLCHSMVAYGTPNQWFSAPHRGRKRCGMQFATDAVRRKLGLNSKPAYDPDVEVGRLTVGDPELHRILYGNTGRRKFAEASPPQRDKAGSKARSSDQAYKPAAADRGMAAARPETPDYESFDGFKEIRKSGTTGKDIAGSDWHKATTLYFFPDGPVKRGDQISEETMLRLPKGTRMLVGYTYGGYLTRKRRAYDVCGARWNYPSTLYRFPDGTMVTGDKMKENLIPENSLVFFRN